MRRHDKSAGFFNFDRPLFIKEEVVEAVTEEPKAPAASRKKFWTHTPKSGASYRTTVALRASVRPVVEFRAVEPWNLTGEDYGSTRSQRLGQALRSDGIKRPLSSESLRSGIAGIIQLS
jgi:hypothetical protein